ncbi:capsid protein (p38) [Japanese iris necrotic ring virus]|uniref:Capsid protein n=1 Tax=Japanese iris necrotic ring virus TaxID=77344 RepID=Q9IR97_9TOMB|nr:capsid protein (p38) [Japanese iris necrotic ring virus]BAA92796.1 capsid protein (p38) [Japanese iris necrotic ring virus]
MALRDEKKVAKLASDGVAWAVKLRSGGGWKTLTTTQKRMARQALGMTQVPIAQTGLRVNRVSQPISVSSRITTGEPRVTNVKRSMTVTFSEMIGVVRSHSSLSTESWVLNPSDIATFPQLSVSAAMYEKYRFTNLAFRFAPSCPTTTGGVVVLVHDPDSSDDLPSDPTMLYEYSGAMRTSAYSPARLIVPTDGAARFVGDNHTSDPKLINFGKLIVANYGQGASDPDMLGEIFIEYTVVLIDRQPSALSTQTLSAESSTGPKLLSRLVEGTKSPYTLTYSFNCGGTFVVSLFYPIGPVSGPVSGSATIIRAYGDAQSQQAQVITVRSPCRGGDFTLGLNSPGDIPTAFVTRA